MIKLNDVTNHVVHEVEPGTVLLDICKRVYPESYRSQAAVLYQNSMVGLQSKVTEDGDIEWVPQDSLEGNQCVQRTLTFLLIRAVLDLFPHGKVQIKHSLGKALYCEVLIGRTLTAEDVEDVERRMRELIDQDEPITQVTVSRQTAMSMCRNRNMEREANMLQHVQVDTILAYQCGMVFDYFMGALLPTMGYVHCFSLRHYAPGLLLRYPMIENPDKLPPYREIPKLARVFLEAEEWGRIVRCQYVADLNKYIESGTIQDIVDMAEALHEKKLAQLADYVVNQRPKIKVVLIAGPSSAGKTTFCKRLITHLRVNGLRPAMISLDDYFLDRENTPRDAEGNYDFESLQAIDIKLFNEQITALNQGQSVHLARFDFKTGHRYFDEQPVQLEAGQPIVVEGLHALNDSLTYMLPRYEKVKISLGALTQIRINDHNRISTTDTRIIRRMVRDHQFRARGPEETLEIWDTVRRGEEKNIYPFQEEADTIFNSALPYELAVLKPYAEPLLNSISAQNPYYHEAQRLLKFLSPFCPLSAAYVPMNSLLREFIGKNRELDQKS
jgi:uridine kinase